jgi:large subunit ribosomal protein L15
MKTLGNLTPNEGSNRPKKRLGRGMGSWGKTAGRGHGGMKKRRGAKVNTGFEGGQTPLHRRIPKRGFTNFFRVAYQPVNLQSLNRFEVGEKVTPEVLFAAGLIQSKTGYVKLLGKGKLEKKNLNIAVHCISETAKTQLESSGGKLEIIPIIKPEAAAAPKAEAKTDKKPKKSTPKK